MEAAGLASSRITILWRKQADADTIQIQSMQSWWSRPWVGHLITVTIIKICFSTRHPNYVFIFYFSYTFLMGTWATRKTHCISLSHGFGNHTQVFFLVGCCCRVAGPIVVAPISLPIEFRKFLIVQCCYTLAAGWVPLFGGAVSFLWTTNNFTCA